MKTERAFSLALGLCLALLAATAASAATIREWKTSLFAGAPGLTGVVDGTGTGARFGASGDMVGDGTYLWLGDGSTVRRVELATAQVVTVAGSTSTGVVDNPIGLNARFGVTLSLAKAGNTVWVADPANGRIRAMSAEPPYAVTTVAGSTVGAVVDGSGTGAVLQNPRGLVHFNGFLYFTDANGTALRRFDPLTTAVVTVAGSPGQVANVDGCGAAARFTSIRHAAADGTGRLFISDTNGYMIRAYDIATGCVTTPVGTGANGYTDGPIATAVINRPRGLAADGESVYWVEFSAHTVRQAVLGATVATLAGPPCLDVFTPGACFSGYVEGTGSQARFNMPWGLVRDPGSGSIFVYDTGNFVIRRLDAVVGKPFDFNGDTRSDVLWRNTADGSVQAWLMNGLTATGIAGLLPAGGGYTVTHVADLNGDGFADLLIRHTDGTVIGWLMNGLTVAGQTTLAPAGSGYTIVKVGDLNGDGKSDLLWQHTDGSVQGWLMDGLSVSSTATFVGAGSGWNVSQVADLDGDGKSDLLWQHTDGSVQAWLMNGLTVAGIASLAPAGSGWSIVLTGDFNADLKTDLMWQHTNGSTQAWLMDGLTVTGLASFTPSGTGWRPALAGDINGDGTADLFWQHTSGASQTWLMNGLAVTSLASFVSAGQWSATHLLDLNGDGKKDVFWRNTDGSVQAWLMNGLTVTGVASLAPPGTYLMIPPYP